MDAQRWAQFWCISYAWCPALGFILVHSAPFRPYFGACFGPGFGACSHALLWGPLCCVLLRLGLHFGMLRRVWESLWCFALGPSLVKFMVVS